MDANEVASQKWERIERFATILAFLTAAILLHVFEAQDALVGGAIGAASALVVPGGGHGRARAAMAAGVGALIGAALGGFDPTMLA